MANTTIQLKRSSVAGKRPTTSTLNIGELALNITDQKLYSSDGSTIFEPAANVTNLNVTSNATLNIIVANGHLGTAGKVLTSNASGGIYWNTSSGGSGGAATAIRQSYTADGYTDTFTVSGGYAANNADVYLNGVKLQTNVEANVQNGSTFTILTGPPPLGASIEIVGSVPITVTTVVAKTGDTMTGVLNVGNSTVGLEYISVGANVNINTSTMSVGNSTVNTQIIAGNVILNGSSITISNSTANIVITDGTLTVSNSTSNVTVGTGSISVGNSTANTTVRVSGLSEGGAPSYINAISYSGTSNSASYIGVLPAANVVSNAQLSSNLANYVTITNLSSNLANYQTTAGLASNVATLAANSANSASYIGTLPASNVVSNSQLSSNLANYQTTAGMSSYQTTGGLASNVATLAANSATYLNGNTASDFRLYADNKADAAYANSISFANTKANNAYANAVSYVEAAILTVNSAITGNASAAYSNSISYINSAISTANSAITGNAAQAYANAIAYSGNAVQAYSNAVAYASNATNISSGTINSARLPYAMNQNVTTTNNVTFANLTITGGTVSSLPQYGTDIVNKQYADSIATGVNFHAAVKYATAAELTPVTYYNGPGANGVGAKLTKTSSYSALSVDSSSPAYLDRILVKNQSNATLNGVYSVTNTGSVSYPWVLSRASDYDQVGTGSNEVAAGDLTYVLSGSTGAGTSWIQNSEVVSIGTDLITFVQFSSKALYQLSSGTGLYYSVGGSFDGSASATLAVNASYIATLTVNNALYLNGNTASELMSYTDSRAGSAYSNAITYSGNSVQAYTNAVAAIAISTSNNTLYVGSVTAANVVSNSQLSSNLLNYAVNSSVYSTFTQNNSLSSVAFSGLYSDISGAPPKYVNMTQTGSLTGPYSGIARYYPPNNMTVSKVIASITYSQSSSSVFKLFKNGVDTGYTFTINSGTNVMTPVSVTISLTTADYLTLNLVSGVFNEFRVQLQYS
jgi:uncharacterized protein YukE